MARRIVRAVTGEAMAAGERFAADFALGEVPAARLAKIMERELSVLVLMVDAVAGVSGAPCACPSSMPC